MARSRIKLKKIRHTSGKIKVDTRGIGKWLPSKKNFAKARLARKGS
jgi:hypothetical protein